MSTGFFVFVRMKLVQLEDARIKEVEKFIFASRQLPFFLIQSLMNDFSRSKWKIKSVFLHPSGQGENPDRR
ncbi:hypothetical protein [Laceyella tengchongensis]|uniref:hypothetical protein n=1 Tax=Laceyella tengchongensis TaxID=574699 RepID=UPI00189065FB